MKGLNRPSDNRLWTRLLGSARAGKALSRFLKDREPPMMAELLTLDGIGPTLGERVLVVVELARRLAAYRSPPRPRITSPDGVYDLLAPEQGNRPTEALLVLALDGRHGVVAIEDAARGRSNGVGIAAREVFRPLIRHAASAGVIVHNHPSGDPLTSVDDIELTERLVAVGEMIGIPLIDHIIIAGATCTALRELGNI